MALAQHRDRALEEITEQHRPDRQEADRHRGNREQHQRQRHHHGRLVRVGMRVVGVRASGSASGRVGVGAVALGLGVAIVVLRLGRERLVAEALRAVEDQEVHPERIERGDEHAGRDREVGEAGAGEVARVHRLDDRVLGVEAGEERRADQRQRADQRRDPGDRHVLAQAAHVADVLVVVHADDHRAGAEEQQRLEERVRHQVEHGDRVGRSAERHRHVAELRQRRVGDDALDVVLDDAEKAHEERRDRADHHARTTARCRRARTAATCARP